MLLDQFSLDQTPSGLPDELRCEDEDTAAKAEQDLQQQGLLESSVRRLRIGRQQRLSPKCQLIPDSMDWRKEVWYKERARGFVLLPV